MKKPDNPFKKSAKSRNLENELKDEFNDIQNAFYKRAKQQQEDFKNMTDTEYWYCLIFPNRALCSEFLEKIGVGADGKYVDGLEVAKSLNIKLESPLPKFKKNVLDKKWSGLSKRLI